MIESATNDGAYAARGSIAVTGGIGDIGLEVCRVLAATGVEPVAIDIASPEIGEEKLSASGVPALYRQADVTNRQQLSGVLASIEGLVGAVANAGVVFGAPFLEVTEEQWERQLSVNLTGVFNTAQVAARLFVEAGIQGRLVFVSSWVHARGQDELVAYSASKAGMTAIVRGAASELARYGILVNAVAPGVVDAGLSRQRLANSDVDAAAVTDRIPLQRLQTAEDVAGVVAFLFSSAASYVTGATLLADGGLSVVSPLGRRRGQQVRSHNVSSIANSSNPNRQPSASAVIATSRRKE